MRRFVSVLIAAMLVVACSNNETATNRAATTTIPLADGIEPGESTPSDYSNPATLPELEGLTIAEAEEQARERGWTTIETYTDDDYSSRAFDADLDVTRLRVIYDPGTGLVLEAKVG